MTEHTVTVRIKKGEEEIKFPIRAEEMRIVEQLLDRLKVYSTEPLEVRYL